jgi:hypothetical protein
VQESLEVVVTLSCLWDQCEGWLGKIRKNNIPPQQPGQWDAWVGGAMWPRSQAQPWQLCLGHSTANVQEGMTVQESDSLRGQNITGHYLWGPLQLVGWIRCQRHPSVVIIWLVLCSLS